MADLALRDGSIAHVRATGPADVEGLAEFLGGLSPKARWSRSRSATAGRGLGIATLLLDRLAELADAAGIETLTAMVHPTNHRMLSVFRDSGFPIVVTSLPGELHVQMPARCGPAARLRFAERHPIQTEVPSRCT